MIGHLSGDLREHGPEGDNQVGSELIKTSRRAQVGRTLGVEHQCDNNAARRLHQKQLGHWTVSKLITVENISTYLGVLESGDNFTFFRTEIM